MIPSRAIEKAREGGYVGMENVGTLQWTHLQISCVLALDSDFWIALGKALGWEHSQEFEVNGIWHDPDWLVHSVTYTRLFLTTGGDTKKFWEEILK